MEAVYIIGGIIAVGGIIWGIIAFYAHVRDTYSYNIFNWINLLMLAMIVVIWLVVLLLGASAAVDASQIKLNSIVCGIITAITLVMIFVRNLKNTSLPVAIGASISQILTIPLILLIIAAIVFGQKKGNKQ